MKFDPSTIGLIRTLSASEPWHARDIAGPLAISFATTDLLEGKPARFARVKHNGAEWELQNIVRFQVEKEEDEVRLEEGYGDMIRIHDRDGSTTSSGSHAIGIYDIRKSTHTEIAIELALYLSRHGATFVRLSPEPVKA